MMPEGITIQLKRTQAALDAAGLSGYQIVYGEPLYFDNQSGQFLAVGDHDSATAANAYLVKLVPRQTTVNGATVNIASNPVFYKVISQSDNTLVAIIKDDGTEIYPKTTIADQIGMGVDSGGIYVVYSDLAIIVQPVSQTVEHGTQVTFSVTAVGSGLSYRWYYRTNSEGEWTAAGAASATTANYTITAEARHNGYQYRCRVTNGVDTVYSDTVTLTVT